MGTTNSTPDSAAPSRPPSIPGEWKLERSLGKGGMGEVWLARHRDISSAVAVKVLNEEYREHSNILARFRQEAVAVQMINSDAIVKIFDYGVTLEERPYIMMEYVEGETVREWLTRRERVNDGAADELQQDVVDLARQVAAAMIRAHERGVIHRDLKPDNIMVVEDDRMPRGMRIKILDFGIAKVVYESNTAAKGFPSTPADLDYTGSYAPVPEVGVIHPGVPPDMLAPTVPDARRADTRTALDVRPRAVASASAFPPTVPQGPLGAARAAAWRAAPPAPDHPSARPETHVGMMGSVGYAAPEQVRDPRSVDGRADVYALGITMHELLSGEEGSDAPWPPPPRPGISADLKSLMVRMVSPDRAGRPHMPELQVALHRIYRGDAKFDAAFALWRDKRILPRGADLHAWLGSSRDKGNFSPEEHEFLKQAAAGETRRQRVLIALQTALLLLLVVSVAGVGWFWWRAARETARADDNAAAEKRERELAESKSRAYQSALLEIGELSTTSEARERRIHEITSSADDAAKAAQKRFDSEKNAKDYVRGERDKLKTERDALKAERDALQAERDQLRIERDALKAERDRLSAERDGLKAARDTLKGERDRLSAERDALQTERDQLRTERDALKGERDRIVAERDALQAERDQLRAERDALKAERDRLKTARDALQAERDALKSRVVSVPGVPAPGSPPVAPAPPAAPP